jgi:hypothetical protein
LCDTETPIIFKDDVLFWCSYKEDDGRPIGVGYQEQASNRFKLLLLRVRVVSVEEKSRTLGRYGLERRIKMNHR